MTKTIKNISQSHYFRPLIFKMLVLALVFSASFYIYFVSSAVSGVIDADKEFKAIARMEHKRVELEKKYMEIASKLDIDYVVNNGYVEQPKDAVYAVRYDTVAQR